MCIKVCEYMLKGVKIILEFVGVFFFFLFAYCKNWADNRMSQSILPYNYRTTTFFLFT